MSEQATLTGTRTANGSRSRTCRLCGGPAEAVTRGAPAIVRCKGCALLSLAEFPSREERDARYQEGYYAKDTGARFLGLIEAVLRFLKDLRVRSILRLSRGPGSILDVGCGRGDLIQLFQDRGWKAVGTQVSRTAAEAARRLRGVDVIIGDLPGLSLAPESFDVVTFLHVLEHLDRPGDYLSAARSLLRPGGLLVIEVPNCAGPGFRWLEQRSFTFDHPNHLVFFTPDSLRALLERAGFEVIEVSHFRLEYSPYTTLQNLLNALPGQPNRLYRALQRNNDGRALRRSPWTWLHALLGAALAVPALMLSALGGLLRAGNTMTFYARRPRGARDGELRCEERSGVGQEQEKE